MTGLQQSEEVEEEEAEVEEAEEEELEEEEGATSESVDRSADASHSIKAKQMLMLQQQLVSISSFHYQEVRACVHACVCMCVRACVRACEDDK